MDHLTSAQLSEWEAYDSIDPIGEWRDDFRFACLLAQHTNLMTWAHAKRGTEYKPSDFMPEWDKEEEVKVQTIEEMKQVFRDIKRSSKRRKGNEPPKRPPKLKK